MKLTRRKFLTATAAAGASLAVAKVWAVKKEDDQAWNDIRKFLFGDRPILNGNGVIRLDAPERPPNGGDVTVKVFSSHPQNHNAFIAKHYMVVDKNPSPISGEFMLSSQTTADIATRIRVNEYSMVRVISETHDGALYMDTAFVKASGGCSAPPMGDDAMAKLMMGKTTLSQTKQEQPGTYGFHLSIVHPSYSGLQKDQITTYFIPAHYVETVEVRNTAGDRIFAVKGDITFSENPSFDFAYKPTAKNDVLSVKVVDSKKKVYESRWPLTMA